MSKKPQRKRRTFLRGSLALGAGAGALWGGLSLSRAGAAPAPRRSASAGTAAAPGVKGKVYAGYQGWFAAQGDGSPLNRWTHWSSGTPAPGNQSFELYPDISAYPAKALFPTGYTPLGNGQPARLFSSWVPAVTDQHFAWMRQYGIDGAALQRFGNEITPGTATFQQRNDIARQVRAAAERNGRGFYIEYDVSGLADDKVLPTIQNDWTATVTGSLQLTASASYAREAGRPVVELWGLGFKNRAGTAKTCLALVNWFKKQGAYVIGGVPRGWRTGVDVQPGFEAVFAALDMLSPWNVGNTDVNRKPLDDDLALLRSRGQDYQPVIYPGFAWSNWKPDGVRNAIPRHVGDFMWQQALAVRRSGAGCAFIAMFDEYDEATAIAPAAVDKSMIPTNQYFLTLDADGTRVSSDFYLRLAGAATEMINGSASISTTVPIAPTV
ncbi:glycoside hydrolase family 71/99-like protein [Streptomyces cacaoi]|uniref:glycoside hydrolase family 71/99-like protein n=1 Tax=Streptomyces cacaoi TaxID=1898 RepID=UPI0026193A48|nr:glycoside hydrolase family 71/99-like protein [Streptomyces cacaoi]